MTSHEDLSLVFEGVCNIVTSKWPKLCPKEREDRGVSRHLSHDPQTQVKILHTL